MTNQTEAALGMLEQISWPSGFSAPDIRGDYEVVSLTGQTSSYVAERYGIGISNSGVGNQLLIHKAAARSTLNPTLRFTGSGNVALIGEQSAFNGRVVCGSGCRCILMGHQHALNLQADLYDDGTLLWGVRSRVYGCRIWVHGQRMVAIEDDCMLSEGITIRTSDHHSIIDLTTFEQTNQPEDVLIQDHVWIGPDVSITRGVRVGRGSIVGMGSVVTRSIPSWELWAGVPAKSI